MGTLGSILHVRINTLPGIALKISPAPMRIIQVDSLNTEVLQGFVELLSDMIWIATNARGAESKLGREKNIISFASALEPLGVLATTIRNSYIR